MVIRLPKKDPIEFLVRRKYPASIVMDVPPSLVGNSHSGMSYQDRENFKKKVNSYKAKLLKLSDDELQALVQNEHEKDRQVREAEAAEIEKTKFYNLSFTDADYNHWSKTAYWTIEESVALSFGKNPDLVSWAKMKDHSKLPVFGYIASPFIEKYRKTRELALRAKLAKQIHDTNLPGFFIAWARRNDIDFPQELVDKVELRGQMIADWKDYYDQLKGRYNAVEKENALLKEKLNHQAADASQSNPITQSEYLCAFLVKAQRAVDEYPQWREGKRIVRKSAELESWLVDTIKADTRESHLIKKILTDVFDEIK